MYEWVKNDSNCFVFISAGDFEDSDMDDQSDSDEEGQRLKPSISAGNQSDSDYNFDDYENENKTKSESRPIENSIKPQEQLTKKRKSKVNIFFCPLQ